jgi:hypothetical protein
MKTYFLALLMLLGVGSSSIMAQPYQSIFGKDSTRWDVLFRTDDASSRPYYYNMILIHTPVTINTQTYWTMNFSTPQNLSYYIREDTTLGKVWYKIHTDSSEKLLYDFSLLEGDTFHFPWSYYQNSPIAKAIVDSIAYIQGRKHIYFAPPFEGEWWHITRDSVAAVFIEGIGSNVSDILSIRELYGEHRICVFKDGVKDPYYKSGIAQELCFIEWLGNVGMPEPKQQKNIRVAPNPTKGMLYISQLPPTVQTLVLYDMQGRVLHSVSNIQTSDYSLDMNTYTPGMYMLQVITTDTPPQYLKVAKE